MSPFFKLDSKDLVKGLVVAVLSSVLTAAQVMVVNQGISFTKADGFKILSVALASAFGYLGKQLLTDKEGKLGGRL